ncbi:MAG TPA: DNA methyltransferase [Gallicola sp.]|nr:DNA methyltransferase [Gallicola sp.]
MSRYPKINYIGNKNNLTDWIIDNLPYKKGKVVDLFCGGCSVSFALKENGYTVYSNDSLYSNYVLAKAIIENNNHKLTKEELEDIVIDKKIVNEIKQNIKFLENRIYFPEEVVELSELIEKSNHLNDEKKYMYLALIRRAMIRKIPYSRMNVPWNQIVKLRDEEYSYEKYKRRRAYHNLTFEQHIYENLENYNESIFDNKKMNKAFQLDSFQMLEKLDEKVDIIYIDPPYPSTMNKYGEFYGYFDKMFNKSIEYENLCSKDTFLEKFEKLISIASSKTKSIVISLNNKTKPSVSDIAELLKKYGKVTIKEKKHQYKVTNKENKNETIEVLIILKIKEEH